MNRTYMRPPTAGQVPMRACGRPERGDAHQPRRPPSTSSIHCMQIRTVLERGPKDKRAVAFAVDWPGWSRGAKTPELALETLERYRERYRPVAVAAGLGEELDAAGPL